MIEVFRRLEEGMSLTKVVVETGLDPDDVKKYYEKWRELREVDPSIVQPKVIDELRAKVEELERALRPLKDFADKLKASFKKVRCPQCGAEWYHLRRMWAKVTSIGVHCPRSHDFMLTID